MWWQRYGEGWELLEPPEYFDFGSAYHLMHEHEGDLEIAEFNAKVAVRKLLPKARELYQTRLHGPPIPSAREREKLRVVTDGPLAGLYTAKPDQIEGEGDLLTARDFKTAGTIRPNDGKKWAVDGEIIGEMVASGCKRAIVDIVTKEQRPKISQIEVNLTSVKEAAHRNTILDLYRQLRERLVMKNQYSAEQAFPRNLRNCCQSKPCFYYARCWEGGAAARLYRINEARKRAWRQHLKLDVK